MTTQENANRAGWTLDLETKPDFDMAMKRVYAWYEQEIIDRPPVRFIAHNADFDVETSGDLSRAELRALWFDEERQVEAFISKIEGKVYRGETFPIYAPNLGPDVYAAFYGVHLEFGEVTSWSSPVIETWDDLDALLEQPFDPSNPYFRKIEDLTRYALERCPGKFMVGFTDIHPTADFAMAMRGSKRLNIDVYDAPEQVERLIGLGLRDFQQIYDHFDAMLKAQNQLSACWMGVPSFGKMHVPSCDWSAMISPAMFQRFSLPVLRDEVRPMTHNIYHVDGPGVARQIDHILSVPDIHAIQWVQGMGTDRPIMQWVSLIQKIQAAGRSVIVDLLPDELEPFMEAVRPEGIYIWIGLDDAEAELDIIKRLRRWT